MPSGAGAEGEGVAGVGGVCTLCVAAARGRTTTIAHTKRVERESSHQSRPPMAIAKSNRCATKKSADAIDSLTIPESEEGARSTGLF